MITVPVILRAQVGRAEIIIVTDGGFEGDVLTGTGEAVALVGGAVITIIAGQGETVGRVRATDGRVAGVVRTDIAIIATVEVLAA